MKIAIDTTVVVDGELSFAEFDGLGEVKYFADVTVGQLHGIIADCEAVIVNKIEVDEAFLNAAPNLKYVGLFSTGYNNVDIAECRRRNITVCNASDYSTNAVCQHVFALILNFYGKTGRYVRSVRDGDWTRSKRFCYFPYETHEIYGKTFGIIGYGSIGRKVARVAEALGLNVIVHTRTAPADCPYPLVPREEIFRRSDILSLHCPLNEGTKQIINADTLSFMKENALLVNTARGGLVDEAALAEALNRGQIAGACLDVVTVEPMKADNPLLNAANCDVTPHIAWVPIETRKRLLGIAAENLRSFLAGNPKNNVAR